MIGAGAAAAELLAPSLAVAVATSAAEEALGLRDFEPPLYFTHT